LERIKQEVLTKIKMILLEQEENKCNIYNEDDSQSRKNNELNFSIGDNKDVCVNYSVISIPIQ